MSEIDLASIERRIEFLRKKESLLRDQMPEISDQGIELELLADAELVGVETERKQLESFLTELEGED